MANAGNEVGRDDEAGIRILGVPLFSFVLKVLAVLAGLLAVTRTAEGVSTLFGGGVVGFLPGMAGAIIVQGGLIAVSLYVASQFVSNRVRRGGPRSSASGSITWLSLLVLAILFALSIFFTYSGTLASSTKDQLHDDRVTASRETADTVLQTIRLTADEEMRRVTQLIRQNEAYKTWRTSMTQLTTLGSQQDVPQLVDRFADENKVAWERYLVERDKRKADIESALVPIRTDLEVRKAAKKRLDEQLKNINVAEIDLLEQLVEAERDGRVVTILGITTTGRPGCAAQCQARQTAVTQARGRIRSLTDEIKKADEDIARLERRRIAVEGGQVCGGPNPTPAQQRRQPQQRQQGQPQQGQPQQGQPQAQQPPAANQQQCQDLVRPPNADLVEKVRTDRAYVNKLTGRLQSNLAAIDDIYVEKTMQETARDCGELKEYLQLIFTAQAQQVRAVSCDPPSLGENVGNVNAFADIQTNAKTICDKIPEQPRITGLPGEEKRLKSLNYLQQVKEFGENCLAASRLAQRGDATKVGREKVAGQLRDLESTYGEGAIYLTRAYDQLVNKKEGRAVLSFAFAFALDSLILVLAFLSELPLVRREATGPKPLTEMERRKLTALIKFAHAAEASEFRAERLLVDNLKANPKTNVFEINIANVGSPEDQALVRSLINSQMGSGDASLAWSVGRDSYAVTQRGYFELLRAMDDAARNRQAGPPTNREGATRTVVGPARQGATARGREYDYRDLFAEKGQPVGEQGQADEFDYLNVPARDGPQLANGDDPTRVPSYPGSNGNKPRGRG